MEFNSLFPARYFINLGRRQDRRIETEIALNAAGITAERFPAVDARFVRNPRGYESAGRYALALTQRLVLRRAALKRASAVLLLEDDVIFHPDFLARMEALAIPDDWGILYLGCAHQVRPSPESAGLVRVAYALDTHAFAVSSRYYRRVIAALAARDSDMSTHPLASDWFLADLHEEIPTYACYPNLVWQAVAASDLAGDTYSNYTASGEQVSAHGETIGLQAEMWGLKRWSGWKASLSRAENPRSPEDRSPRLGLLFLTRGDVCHPGIWQEFTMEAGDDIKVFSHPQDPAAASRGFLAETAIGTSWPTAWGDISIVRAMLSLLQAAMEDETLTHFAFVSETCIPIRPWAEMKRRLQLDPRSIICYTTSVGMSAKHLKRAASVVDLPERCRRMHSQWCLLDREAATCVTEVDLTGRFEHLEAPDEHYFGSLLAVRGFNEAALVNNSPLTWLRWDSEEDLVRVRTHVDIDPALIAELAHFPGFFARKFPAGSTIGRWGLHRSSPGPPSAKGDA